MVEFNYNDHNDGAPRAFEGILSITMMSCAIVVSLFFGIKLRWFRYRMKFPSIEESPSSPPVLYRSTSLREVRENCSTGRYSHIDIDNSSGGMSNYTTPVASSSSFSVKSKSKERESIFKWPFKSRMDLKKQHSLDEENYRRPVGTEVRDKDLDLATMEKNERLKRSIHERLYPSASMPDLLQRDDISKAKIDEKPAEIKIHTGVVVDESTQFVTVDEIKMPKRPVRVKMRRAPSIPTSQVKKEEQDVEDPPVQSPKPPTPPVRRQSRSNSLRASQIEIPSSVPPVVMPRRHINQTYMTIESVDDSSNEQPHQIEVPKSILKTDDHHHVTKVHHITFVNVPDSPPSSDDEEFRENRSVEEEETQDVWTRIDIHRSQLKRLQEMESVSRFDESDDPSQESDIDEIPPLPITPPPLNDDKPYLREFSFA